MTEKTNLYLMRQELHELEKKQAEKQKMESQLWYVEKELEEGVSSTVRLRELMRAKHVLDHELDRFEEVDCNSVEELKKHIFASLIKKFPEIRPQIESTLQDLGVAQNEKVVIESTEAHILQMEQAQISIEDQHKHATSFFGFIRSIFGKSPTAQITIQIKELAKIAGSLQALLSRDTALNEDFVDATLTLINFVLIETKERWSFKSIAKFKEQFPIEIYNLKKELAKCKEENHKTILAIEAQLENWMEKE